ncbi:hypothetical protein [Bradyrhizobium sp. LHD-71]|uniref:hypothetical protein n=1 Tax=Bradyrhizobium sp. LHD-71 TaxID=3072141 RepID=UPI00280F47BE|nr:hypothetical protein [Bradyrhizobium sp. LHD-71]MDQ8727241.1 hypothetical protein [Bradyrhizobium sp. LHD-71]
MTLPISEAVLTELLGFCAGGMIAVSALPRVWEIMRRPDVAAAEPISRNTMLAAGNLLWVAYGIASGALAITVMCTVAGILNGLVLAFAISARRTHGKPPVT